MSNVGCTSCGEPVEADERFCGNCGDPLVAAGIQGAMNNEGVPGKRRVGPGWLIGSGIVIVVVLAILGAWRGLGDSDSGGSGSVPDWSEFGLPDPESAPLAQLEEDESDEIRDFLQEEGRALMDFHSVSATVIELSPDDPQVRATCLDLIEDAIEPIASFPSDLMELAEAIPDEALAALWLDDILNKWDVLAECVQQQRADEFSTLRAEAAYTHVILTRQLDELAFLEEG